MPLKSSRDGGAEAPTRRLSCMPDRVIAISIATPAVTRKTAYAERAVDAQLTKYVCQGRPFREPCYDRGGSGFSVIIRPIICPGENKSQKHPPYRSTADLGRKLETPSTLSINECRTTAAYT